MYNKKRRTCLVCRKKRYADNMQTVVHRLHIKPFLSRMVDTFIYAVCNTCADKVQGINKELKNEIVLSERTIF